MRKFGRHETNRHDLNWALREMQKSLGRIPPSERVAAAYAKAAQMADEDVETCRLIGHHGQAVIADIAARKNGRVNVLTHCNAGWLATVDWGTALSPDLPGARREDPNSCLGRSETRPRNQGAALTAFELGAHGVPHTIIADNAAAISCSMAMSTSASSDATG